MYVSMTMEILYIFKCYIISLIIVNGWQQPILENKYVKYIVVYWVKRNSIVMKQMIIQKKN